MITKGLGLYLFSLVTLCGLLSITRKQEIFAIHILFTSETVIHAVGLKSSNYYIFPQALKVLGNNSIQGSEINVKGHTCISSAAWPKSQCCRFILRKGRWLSIWNLSSRNISSSNLSSANKCLERPLPTSNSPLGLIGLFLWLKITSGLLIGCLSGHTWVFLALGFMCEIGFFLKSNFLHILSQKKARYR